MTIDQAKRELSPRAEWDENIEPYSEQKFVEIPRFDLPIAASGWEYVVDNQDGGYFLTAAQIQQGLFSVLVRGTSMQPDFMDGQAVLFRLMMTPEGTPDFDSLREGMDVYVQLDDHTGTFKRVEKIEPDHILLRAVNKKFKVPLIAPIERVQRLARARGHIRWLD